MANKRTSVIVFSLLVLTAIIISACTQPYSNVPLETPTANPTNLFVSPFPTSDNPMDMIGEYATSTSAAETAVALTAGTPLVTEEPVEITPDSPAASATPDPNVTPAATNTPVPPTAAPTNTQAPAQSNTNRPATYTLQPGEFPYCIARRFNLDPSELLNLNGLTSGDIYYPNLTLTIPQTNKPFPGTRALQSHPATYTVQDPSVSVYGVACHYGDVDPAAIAQANNLQLTAKLTVGQQLTIP
jgi:LysM repeat protein